MKVSTDTRRVPPLRGKSKATYVASIPGSKSYTNRALILAAQRPGRTRVTGALASDDTRYLANGLGSFGGVDVEETPDGFVAERTSERLAAPDELVYMGGAGTPARFMLSFASTAAGVTRIGGNPRLEERPMKDLLDVLAEGGVRLDWGGAADHLPVSVHGGPMRGVEWSVRADVSSQFTSSLCLLAAQQPVEEVRIHLVGHQVSIPYVNMTLAMMTSCGIRAERADDATIRVVPGSPQTETIPVEVDASGMSYFLAAAAVTGSTVEIQGIGRGSAQGDVGLAAAFAEMGAEVEMTEDRIRITGRTLRGIDIDMETMPDVVLTLAAVAALAEGSTRIHNIANLRVKECDRINAAARELERLGVEVEEGQDFIVIHPTARMRPAKIHTYDDHRVAMAFAVLGLVHEGVEIEDPGCVSKSFPGFWDELDRFRRHHE